MKRSLIESGFVFNVSLLCQVVSVCIVFFSTYLALSLHVFADQPSVHLPEINHTPRVIVHGTELSGGRITVGADQRIWHSSMANIYAFDGRHWLHYPQLMSPTSIHAIRSQDATILWLGTRQNGLYRYDIRTDTLQHLYTEGFEQGDVPRYTVSSMCFSPDKKNMITAGLGAVLAINTLSGQQQRLLPENATSLPSFVVCHEHFALVSLNDGSMHLIDMRTNDIKAIGELIKSPYVKKQHIDRMTEQNGLLPILLNKNQLLVAVDNQLLLVNLTDNSLLPFGPEVPHLISSIVRQQNGRIWLSTLGAGIYVLSESGALLHHLTVEQSNLPSNSVTSLALSDDEWLFGLSDQHLIQVSLQASTFQYLQSENTLTPWYAASFLQPGKLWLVEAFSRLLQMDNDSQQLTDMTPSIRQLLAQQGEERSLYISALHHHTLEELWFSNREQLVRYLPLTNTLTLFDKKNGENAGPKRRVRHIFTDRQQRLWFTDLGSLLLFDNETQRFQRWPLVDASLPDAERRFVKIAQDQQDRLWAIGQLGLYLVNNGQLEQVYAYQGKGFLHDLTIDDMGNPWLLSSENLIKVNAASGFKVTELTPPEDYNVLLHSLIAYKNVIWVGTRSGLVQFNDALQQWQQFSWGDGINASSAYQRGAYRLGNDLIFMTQAGMLVFDPESLVKPEPKEMIREIQVRTGTNDWQRLENGIPLMMPETEHWLEFLLHVTEFRYPEQLRFRYKLVGYDPDWNRSSALSQFAYTGIPAGSYRLLVEVYYRHNNQLVASLAQPVHILPPWYRSFWAYSSYLMILLCSLLLFYLYRRQRVSQIIAYESEIASSLQRAVQAQQREEELALLGDLGKELTAHLQLDDVWIDFIRAAGKLIALDRVLLLCLQQPDKQTIHPDILFMSELPEVLSFVVNQRCSVPQLQLSKAMKTLPSQLQLMLLSNSVLHITISRNEQIYGAVFLTLESVGDFDSHSVSPLNMLVEFLAVALENISAYQHSQTLERQLLQQQKVQSLGRLVAGLAHEMNTPAGTAITAASLVHDQLDVAKQSLASGTLTKSILQKTFYAIHEGNDLVQRNLNRLSGLIEQFKLLASVNEKPEMKRVAAWSLFRSLVEVRGQHAPEVQLTLDMPEQEFYLELSKSGLQLIFQQVIDNVFEHAGQQQSELILTVQLQRNGHQLTMSFCDNGVGLTSETTTQYLEPFFTTARHRGRVGLGLAIAHNLTTELLGGSIVLENNPKGGCCVMISLPSSIEYA